jgi:hypothetical protein
VEHEKEAHAEAADAHIRRRGQPDDARKNAPAKRQIEITNLDEYNYKKIVCNYIYKKCIKDILEKILQ